MPFFLPLLAVGLAGTAIANRNNTKAKDESEDDQNEGEEEEKKEHDPEQSEASEEEDPYIQDDAKKPQAPAGEVSADVAASAAGALPDIPDTSSDGSVETPPFAMSQEEWEAARLAAAEGAPPEAPENEEIPEVPGVYMITRQELEVTERLGLDALLDDEETQAQRPPVVTTLDLGTFVRVREVSKIGSFVRGKLDKPKGWITIRGLEDGVCCAEQVPSKYKERSEFTDETAYLSYVKLNLKVGMKVWVTDSAFCQGRLGILVENDGSDEPRFAYPDLGVRLPTHLGDIQLVGLDQAYAEDTELVDLPWGGQAPVGKSSAASNSSDSEFGYRVGGVGETKSQTSSAAAGSMPGKTNPRSQVDDEASESLYIDEDEDEVTAQKRSKKQARAALRQRRLNTRAAPKQLTSKVARPSDAARRMVKASQEVKRVQEAIGNLSHEVEKAKEEKKKRADGGETREDNDGNDGNSSNSNSSSNNNNSSTNTSNNNNNNRNEKKEKKQGAEKGSSPADNNSKGKMEESSTNSSREANKSSKSKIEESSANGSNSSRTINNPKSNKSKLSELHNNRENSFRGSEEGREMDREEERQQHSREGGGASSSQDEDEEEGGQGDWDDEEEEQREKQRERYRYEEDMDPDEVKNMAGDIVTGPYAETVKELVKDIDLQADEASEEDSTLAGSRAHAPIGIARWGQFQAIINPDGPQYEHELDEEGIDGEPVEEDVLDLSEMEDAGEVGEPRKEPRPFSNTKFERILGSESKILARAAHARALVRSMHDDDGEGQQEDAGHEGSLRATNEQTQLLKKVAKKLKHQARAAARETARPVLDSDEDFVASPKAALTEWGSCSIQYPMTDKEYWKIDTEFKATKKKEFNDFLDQLNPGRRMDLPSGGGQAILASWGACDVKLSEEDLSWRPPPLRGPRRTIPDKPKKGK